MPIFTDLAQAEVRRTTKKLYGQTLSRPALLVSDGFNTTYACDVNIGPTDPTGQINQYIDEKTGRATDLSGLPGQPKQDWQLGDDLTINTVIRNVTIARGNEDLIYADVGSPVELTKNFTGQWEITGFSRQMPGTYTITPVDIPGLTFGPIGINQVVLPDNVLPEYGILVPPITIDDTIDFTIATRLLTFGELGTLGVFGITPFGASGIFHGGSLLRIV